MDDRGPGSTYGTSPLGELRDLYTDFFDESYSNAGDRSGLGNTCSVLVDLVCDLTEPRCRQYGSKGVGREQPNHRARADDHEQDQVLQGAPRRYGSAGSDS